MSKSYIIIPSDKFPSIFINFIELFLNKKYFNKINLVNFNYYKNEELNIKNLKIYNINYNYYKIFNNYLFTKFLNKFNNILKNNNYPIVINGIPINIFNINTISIINNLDIVKISNSYIIFEIYIYDNYNLNKFSYLINKLIIIFNKFFIQYKFIGVIIINLNNKDKTFIKKIKNFLNEKKIKIIEYFYINLSNLNINFNNIVKLTNFRILNNNNNNFIIDEILLLNKNFKLINKIDKNKKFILIKNISNIENIYLFLNNLKFKNNCIIILILNYTNINNLIKNINIIIKKINFNLQIYISNENFSKILYLLYKFNTNDIYYKNNNNWINKIYKLDFKITYNCYSKKSSYIFKKNILDISKSSYNKKILFHEWNDIRILKSICFCQKNNIAECYILGNPDKIYNKFKENFIFFDNKINIIDPEKIRNNYLNRFLEIRKKDNLTIEEAKINLLDNMTLCTMLLDDNIVSGIVAGSINTTYNTLIPALKIIKTSLEYSIVSSLFLMLFDTKVLIYSDCAVNINPNYEQICEIVFQTYTFSKKIGIYPKIALLSYSTYNSSKGESVEKIIKSKDIILKKYPYIILDGPIQYDSATSLSTSILKCPNSILKGDANVFIFPNLDSGNITYKAVQKTNNIIAIGPILQGLNKPVNDLSRGCTIDDIIYTIAITVIQSNIITKK